jgi:hypothetical protein
MPKYRVLVQQYVEQVGEFEIEADTLEDAEDKASMADLYFAVRDGSGWREGDDCYKAEMYAIMDESGDLVWER